MMRGVNFCVLFFFSVVCASTLIFADEESTTHRRSTIRGSPTSRTGSNSNRIRRPPPVKRMNQDSKVTSAENGNDDKNASLEIPDGLNTYRSLTKEELEKEKQILDNFCNRFLLFIYHKLVFHRFISPRVPPKFLMAMVGKYINENEEQAKSIRDMVENLFSKVAVAWLPVIRRSYQILQEEGRNFFYAIKDNLEEHLSKVVDALAHKPMRAGEKTSNNPADYPIIAILQKQLKENNVEIPDLMHLNEEVEKIERDPVQARYLNQKFDELAKARDLETAAKSLLVELKNQKANENTTPTNSV